MDSVPPVEEAALHFRLLLDDLERLGDVIVSHWEKYISNRLDLAAVGAATNMALLLAKDLEESARTSIVNIMATDHKGREATVRTLSRVLSISEQKASDLVDVNVYLPLYNFILGSPQPHEQTTEDFLVEEKV